MKAGKRRQAAVVPLVGRRDSRRQQSTGVTSPVHIETVLAEVVDAIAVLAADLWLEGRLDALPALDESLGTDE